VHFSFPCACDMALPSHNNNNISWKVGLQFTKLFNVWLCLPRKLSFTIEMSEISWLNALFPSLRIECARKEFRWRSENMLSRCLFVNCGIHNSVCMH
jgi:hypothetical protein